MCVYGDVRVFFFFFFTPLQFRKIIYQKPDVVNWTATNI